MWTSKFVKWGSKVLTLEWGEFSDISIWKYTVSWYAVSFFFCISASSEVTSEVTLPVHFKSKCKIISKLTFKSIVIQKSRTTQVGTRRQCQLYFDDILEKCSGNAAGVTGVIPAITSPWITGSDVQSLIWRQEKRVSHRVAQHLRERDGSRVGFQEQTT